MLGMHVSTPPLRSMTVSISAVLAVDALTAEVRPAILLLLAAVVLLLLAATANVASLQLARATTRRREIALRAAIGAGTARLTQQLIVESGLIGIGGGFAGLCVVVALHRVLPSVLPADFPRVDAIAIDGRVLLFGVTAALITSMACGLLPALQARRIDLTEALADGSTGATGGVWRSRTGRWRAVIMVGQVAVACVLLVGAALLTRSFTALMHADRGYDPSNVLTARIDLPATYTVPRRVVFLDTLLERLRAVAGITHVAAGNALPFLSFGGSFGFAMPSPRDPAIKLQVQTMTRVVSPDYFQSLRLRLLKGRPLADTDTMTSRPVIVVNRTFARRYLGDEPIGARVPMPFGDGKPDCDVVGVVEDMRQGDVTEAETPEIFTSYRQLSSRLSNAPMIVVARTTGDPEAMIPMLRAAVREQDRLLVVDSIMTLDERVMTSLSWPRTYAMLVGAFALSALVIAGVGLFGVLSYTVAQRSREIGVRTALGAQPRDIAALVLRQGMLMAGAGLAAGLAAAGAAVRVLSAFLYGVTTHDPLSFVIVPVVLGIVTAVACIVPARRAARVDPLAALRSG
jgi:putative ABC transport system permease protein